MPAYGWVVRDVSLEQYVGAIHPSKKAAGVALKAARLLEPRHTFELEELKPPAVSVTVTGALDPAAAALDSFAAGFDELIAAADEQAARLLEAAAQTLVPTDTGRLAASASFGSGTISYGVPYAVCVFGGTVTMVARPWIIDAAEQVESERLAIYEAAIAAAWEQL